MDETLAFGIVAVAIPLTAVVLVWTSDTGTDITERHHSHHDTYLIANTLTWTLVFAMVFMGALGVLLGWLCTVGGFRADPVIVLSFFDSFLVVSFVYWLLLRRYKVVTYEDHLEVTPFMGRKATIPYEDISHMESAPSLLFPSGRNIHIFVGHRRRALLWSVLDLDQILLRIDRFDALDVNV